MTLGLAVVTLQEREDQWPLPPGWLPSWPLGWEDGADIPVVPTTTPNPASHPLILNLLTTVFLLLDKATNACFHQLTSGLTNQSPLTTLPSQQLPKGRKVSSGE